MQHELVYEQPTAARAPEPAPAQLEVAEARPHSGPAAAAVVAAGLAAFALGVLSVLAAASEKAAETLTLSERVGEVSGLTTLTAVVFFAAWGCLAVAWRRADPPLARVAVVAAILVALALLGTFPPFFNALG